MKLPDPDGPAPRRCAVLTPRSPAEDAKGQSVVAEGTVRLQRSSITLSVLFLFVAACVDKGEKKVEETKESKKKEETVSLSVSQGDPPVEGPIPPETSMVFFSVEGALYPLACYDHAKKALKTGDECMAMVPPGAEVRLSSLDAEYNKVAGGAAEPQCLIGSGRSIAIGVEGISEGAEFVYGVWPRSAMKVIKPLPDDSRRRRPKLGDDEIAKLKAAIKANGGQFSDDLEMRAHQVTEIDVDGNGTLDRFYSVFFPDPKLAEQYIWSGAFLALDDNLDKPIFIDKSKSQRDVFEVRGTLDLNGEGPSELWLRLVFDEGAGERVVAINGDKAEGLGEWSCGAGV